MMKTVSFQLNDQVRSPLAIELWTCINRSLSDEIYTKISHDFYNDIESGRWAANTGTHMSDQLEDDHATY